MSEPATAAPRTCDVCYEPIAGAVETGWECECGVVVCTDADCYDECFKTVASGEGVRCRACGHLS